MIKKLSLALVATIIYLGTLLEASPLSPVDVENIKIEITNELSGLLEACAQNHPILVMVGGYPGSGKSSLIHSLHEIYDIGLISDDLIRQAIKDRGLWGSIYDGEIVEGVVKRLLLRAFKRHINVVIDGNAYSKKIKKISCFIEKNPIGKTYQLAKICLNPSIETLYRRVSERIQVEGLHQGSLEDLERDLLSTTKKIDINDYTLIINNDDITFETELKIVRSYLDAIPN